MTIRAMGPFNGPLPESTGIAIGFVRDPMKAAHLQYTQFVEAPEVLFRWFSFDPDEPVRIANTDEQVWAFGDYRPTGKASTMRGEWLAERIQRWDFPYTIDDQTIRAWSKQGISPNKLLDRVKLSQAMTHRSYRIVSAISGASWGSNTGTPQSLLGLGAPVYFNQSSGTQYDPGTGIPNPAFQIIKRTLNRIRRRIDLLTNGAIGANEMNFVMPPLVANAVSECGEIVDFLKQSTFAKDLISWRNQKWNLPDAYAGFNWVVEDAPLVNVRQNAAGTVASLSANEKLYLMQSISADACYVCSRPGGVDGGYGMPNFSTVQLYTLNGGTQVQAFSEPKHELIEGHVVMADKPVVVSTLSGFKLTSVLDPVFA